MRKKSIKKLVTAAAVLGMLFALSGCKDTEPVDEPPEVVPEVPRIILEAEMYAETMSEGDDEIAAYAYNMPKLVMSDGSQSDICDVFNGYYASIAEEHINTFKNTTYPEALEQYNSMQDGESWGDRLYFSEMKYMESTSGDYIGIALDTAEWIDDAAVESGYIAAMYDKGNGKFITFEDMTDDYPRMRSEIADVIIDEMTEQGLTETCYEGYSDKVMALEGAQMHFTEDGAIIVFPKETIGSSKYVLLVEYNVFDSFLNDYAGSLLCGFIGVCG